MLKHAVNLHPKHEHIFKTFGEHGLLHVDVSSSGETGMPWYCCTKVFHSQHSPENWPWNVDVRNRRRGNKWLLPAVIFPWVHCHCWLTSLACCTRDVHSHRVAFIELNCPCIRPSIFTYCKLKSINKDIYINVQFKS